MRKPWLVFAALAATTAQAVAQDTYYKKGEEGWYWYNDPPVNEDVEEEVEPVVIPVLPEPQPTELTPEVVELPEPPKAPTPPAPPPGSVEFLRQAMPVALDVATNDPTPANVERYLLLQKEALDRSETFSEMAKLVTTGHPELDEGRRRPRQDTFAKQLEEESEENKREVLTELFKTNGLIMFMDKNCSGCALMAENFYRMQKTHGLVWQSVSMDGTLLPPEISDEQSFDAGLSEQLGVSNGGAVFIASPPTQFVAVTWNPTGGAEIADRILLVAKRAGMITDEAFRRTQAVNPRLSEVTHIQNDELPEILRQTDEFLRPTVIEMRNESEEQ